MALNLLKKYSQLLDITAMSEYQRKKSLQGIFDRDITNNPNFKFQTKQINPTPADGQDGIKTYIYDRDEQYVIVIEPMRKKNEYYLLTAYYLEGKDKAREKIMKNFKRRLSDVV